ncbi:MAG: helix-turn-helix domain-containing protein [Prevotellaceae bacterium]|jgi:transcriptional regulator with XRE-family HTH domain|nr:helix-turn-helix domain-containing protein [Prevotellaceae bacterium]
MEENSRKRIGERVRELRLMKGLTKQKLARLTNISSASVTRMEAGRHSVGIDTLAKIAAVLDSSLEIVEDGILRVEDRIWDSERERILVQLKNIRIEKNLRQHKFADMLGIACCNMSLIESAKRSTGTEIVAHIAELLNCRLEIVTNYERRAMTVKKIKNSRELSQEELDFLRRNHKKPISFLGEKLERSEIDIKSNLQRLKLRLREENGEQTVRWVEKRLGESKL